MPEQWVRREVNTRVVTTAPPVRAVVVRAWAYRDKEGDVVAFHTLHHVLHYETRVCNVYVTAPGETDGYEPRAHREFIADGWTYVGEEVAYDTVVVGVAGMPVPLRALETADWPVATALVQCPWAPSEDQDRLASRVREALDAAAAEIDLIEAETGRKIWGPDGPPKPTGGRRRRRARTDAGRGLSRILAYCKEDGDDRG